ncbi:hypothetical protein GCM10027346_37460 [Hymenobacter seoulensis]
MSHLNHSLTEASVNSRAWQLLTVLLQQLNLANPLSCTLPVTTIFPGEHCPTREHLTQIMYALRGCGLRIISFDEKRGKISSYMPLFTKLGYDDYPYQIIATFNPGLVNELKVLGAKMLYENFENLDVQNDMRSVLLGITTTLH